MAVLNLTTLKSSIKEFLDRLDQLELVERQEQQGIKEPPDLWGNREPRVHPDLLEYRQQHPPFYTVLHLGNLGRQVREVFESKSMAQLYVQFFEYCIAVL